MSLFLEVQGIGFGIFCVASLLCTTKVWPRPLHVKEHRFIPVHENNSQVCALMFLMVWKSGSSFISWCATRQKVVLHRWSKRTRIRVYQKKKKKTLEIQGMACKIPYSIVGTTSTFPGVGSWAVCTEPTEAFPLESMGCTYHLCYELWQFEPRNSSRERTLQFSLENHNTVCWCVQYKLWMLSFQ